MEKHNYLILGDQAFMHDIGSLEILKNFNINLTIIIINNYGGGIFDYLPISNQNNIEFARGLTSFSSIEIEKIKGSHSSQIKNILGYSGREEIIHKDDLVKV